MQWNMGTIEDIRKQVKEDKRKFEENLKNTTKIYLKKTFP